MTHNDETESLDEFCDNVSELLTRAWRQEGNRRGGSDGKILEFSETGNSCYAGSDGVFDITKYV